MSKAKNIIICFLLIYSFISASSIEASELVGQSWSPNCEKLKKDFLFDQGLHAIFSEKPNLQIKQSSITLHWNNLEVSIPAVEYTDIYILLNNKNEYEILLQTIDGVTISLLIGEDKLIEDLFAEITCDGEIISKLEGVLATKEMFGGPVRMSTIMKLAYKSTPDLLTCMEMNRKHEAVIATALILKDTATDNLVAVYEGIGEHDGWITKSINDNNIDFSLFIISDNPDQLFNINFRMPEGSKYEYLPFCVGSKKDPVKDTPSWLVSLNNAIEMKTNDSWEEFISAAKEIGISEKSISKTCKNLNLKPKP